MFANHRPTRRKPATASIEGQQLVQIPHAEAGVASVSPSTPKQLETMNHLLEMAAQTPLHDSPHYLKADFPGWIRLKVNLPL